MELQLTTAEASLLANVLEQARGELSMEIQDTDSSRYREGLRAQKDVLASLIEKVRKAVPAP
jgi:hypothetical protein